MRRQKLANERMRGNRLFLTTCSREKRKLLNEFSMKPSAGQDRSKIRIVENLLEGSERRSPWATARQIVQAAQEHPVVLGISSDVVKDLEKLVHLHERAVKDEYVQEVTKQGLLLERHAFLHKLRQVKECGIRCEWAAGYGHEEERVLAEVREILQEKPPPVKEKRIKET